MIENNQPNTEEIINENTTTPLSPEQETELVKNELAIIPEAERRDVMKVVKTADIVLIDSHKKKLKSFKSRFPAKRYEISEGLTFNKEVYEKALAQWREIKNYRTKNVESDFKSLKEPYIALTKFYNATCTPIVNEFKAIEKPISDFVDKLEELERAEKEKEKILARQRTENRVNTLVASGCIFDGSYWAVGSPKHNIAVISLGVAEVENLPDSSFQIILEQVAEKAALVAEAEENERLALAEEKRLKDEKDKKDREQLLADQKRLEDEKKQQEEERAEMRRQLIEMRGEQLEMLGFVKSEKSGSYLHADLKVLEDVIAETSTPDWKKHLSEIKNALDDAKQEAQEKDREIQRQSKIAAIVENRKSQVAQIGLVFSAYTGKYEFNSVPVLAENILLDTSADNDWDKNFDLATNVVINLTEEKRIKEEEEKKASEKRIADKAIADQKEKDDIAEKLRLENLAKAGDKAIWDDFVSRLRAVELPTVKSNDYMILVSKVEQFITSLK